MTLIRPKTLRKYLKDGRYLLADLDDFILGAAGACLPYPIELLNCRKGTVRNLSVDCKHAAQIGILLNGCHDVDVENVQVFNAVTLNDDGGEGHGFQVNAGSEGIALVGCPSSNAQAGEMEDHFSICASGDVTLRRCTATGPVRETGSGICVDRGSGKVSIEHCTVKGGPIVVTDGKVEIFGTSVDSAQDVAARISDEWYGRPIHVELGKGNNWNGKGVYVANSPKVVVKGL